MAGISILIVVILAAVIVYCSLVNSRFPEDIETGQKRYQTFWRRFWASFIDGLVFFPFGFAIDKLTSSHTSEWIVFGGDLFYGLLSVGYTMALHWRYGATIGKMATGVRVVRHDTEGRISLWQSFLRESPLFGLMIIGWTYSALAIINDYNPDARGFATFFHWSAFIWLALEIITMLANKKRRAVHDLIARTVVVKDV